ncbi:MAG TPA: phosphatase PAP2 family protein [Acidobacteriota bacterium]|jgi:membrane-associated phospholipid phosphatase|nr:phosphatase PAP2 family protein [Acidobacteriota bacterium]
MNGGRRGENDDQPDRCGSASSFVLLIPSVSIVVYPFSAGLTSCFSPLPTWLVLWYLGIHSIHLLAARHRPANRNRALLINFLLACLFAGQLLGLELEWLCGQKWFRITALWSPIAFFWWAYLWAGSTLHVYYPRDFSFDSRLIHLEERLFKQPSLWLASSQRPWLTDLLHFLYNTYYAYTPLIGLYLHVNGRIPEFQSATFAVIFGYALCYAFFPFMPVFGPRWGLVQAGLLPQSKSRLTGGWMTRVTNAIMWGGPAHKGCAMPSAHSSTGMVFLIWSWRLWGVEGGIPATLVVAGMMVGAVYGRYHYVIDMVVGGILGTLCVLAADWVI